MAPDEARELRPGDRAVCTAGTSGFAPSSRRLTAGETYVVKESDHSGFVRVEGSFEWWSVSRFERVVETACSNPATEAPDPISPTHYARYKIEPITFIMENKLPYAVGNVVKYVCRFDAKNGLEDLKKAKRYVEFLIEEAEREAE